MKKSLPDMVISIVLLAFLTSLAVQVPEIPAVSRMYPVILLGVSYLMALYLLIKSVVKMKTQEKQETQVFEQIKIILPYCLMIGVYLFLMGKLGYILSTILFMLASLIYLKLKNKALMIVLTLTLTVALYYVFTNFLAVILPRGAWINISF